MSILKDIIGRHTSKGIPEVKKKGAIAIEKGTVIEVAGMKDISILALADTHRSLRQEEKERLEKARQDVDVVITLGDVPFETLLQIQPDYGVLGNHDSFGLLGTWDIQGRCVDVGGCSITGLQGSHRYKEGRFVMYSQEESMLVDIPKADIFISHDSMYREESTDPAHRGLQGITNYIETKGPKLHLHGHYHKQNVCRYGNTISIGVYKCCKVVVREGRVEIRQIF